MQIRNHHHHQLFSGIYKIQEKIIAKKTEKIVGGRIIGMLKKVVWEFPERNEEIIGWLVGIL